MATARDGSGLRGAARWCSTVVAASVSLGASGCDGARPASRLATRDLAPEGAGGTAPSVADTSDAALAPTGVGAPGEGRADELGRASTDPPLVTGSASVDAGGDGAAPGVGGGPGTVTDDRCGVAVHDPARPPVALELSGNLGVHDPTLIEQGGVFYLLATGDDLGAKTSTDLLTWQRQPDVFSTLARPAFLEENVPGVTNLWAPDLSFFGGQYHAYYSASTFGQNTSCIGHLTRPRLDEGTWADQGPVLCSGGGDDYNAIDPNVVVDEAGTAWLSFGSFWDGIKAIELDLAGARVGGAVISLASRGGGAIEAPVIVRRCGYYYLFVSFDACCRGADSTYNTRVGRSLEVMGPYVDRDDRALLDGGGTVLLEGDDTWRGPGHNAVIFSGDRAYNVYHAYAATNGAPTLRIAELTWDEAGWPVSGGP